MKRKICIFTGTRAEYGLLKPLMDEIKKDTQLQLQLLVTGMHLSKEFGLTYKQIEQDGFRINKKVDMDLRSDSPVGISRSIGLGVINISKALADLKPDILVILGDRFEALAAAVAATVARIPIAHLNGGEATEGLIDEAIRHSITKMSYLHFTSMRQYQKRVIQLGEDPKRVFNVGAISLDNIKNLSLLSRRALEQDLKISFQKHNLLITFHPVTLEKGAAYRQFQELLSSLDELKDTSLIFTKANADTEGRVINRMIEKYVRKNPHNAQVFASLGQLRYLSLMQYVDAVVGNSSSGILEAPSFKIGTINIGDRQKGRVCAKSIIDCEPARKDINRAFKKLYSAKFQQQLKTTTNLYGDGRTAPRIKKILKVYPLGGIKKKFFNIQ